jgi:alkylhydroperoxidase family enzyme
VSKDLFFLKSTTLYNISPANTIPRNPSNNSPAGPFNKATCENIGMEESQGKLRKLYDRIAGRTKGSVANILMVHSLNPDAMEAHLNLPKQEKLMLYYVQKLTKEPYNIKENDVKALKKVGFTDRDIFDINQVTAYFNYVNRIADGLGVALEL